MRLASFQTFSPLFTSAGVKPTFASTNNGKQVIDIIEMLRLANDPEGDVFYSVNYNLKTKNPATDKKTGKTVIVTNPVIVSLAFYLASHLYNQGKNDKEIQEAVAEKFGTYVLPA